MNYYAALDVSLRSVHLCVMDQDGEIQAEGQVDSEPQDIDEFLRKLGLEITTVGLETGTLTQYLTYGLRTVGYQVVWMEARQVKGALSAMRNKTDKNDARGLFKVFGIKLPPKLGHGSFDHSARETIEKDPALCHALLPLLDARLVLYHTFRELDNRTRKMAHQDPVCQRLMSTPGVGSVTALTFKAAVDNPFRFKHSRSG